MELERDFYDKISWALGSNYENMSRVETLVEGFNKIKRPELIKFVDLGCGYGLPIYVAQKVFRYKTGDEFWGIEKSDVADITMEIFSPHRIIKGDFMEYKDFIRSCNIVFTYHPYEGFSIDSIKELVSDSASVIYINDKGVLDVWYPFCFK